MAYVFGIEGVPIFEMLFIISVLLLIGLIFVLLELTRISKIVDREKKELRRFDEYLEEFEEKAGKKSSNQLIDYINLQLSHGFGIEQIEEVLVQHGWPKAEIDDIIKKISK